MGNVLQSLIYIYIHTGGATGKLDWTAGSWSILNLQPLRDLRDSGTV